VSLVCGELTPQQKITYPHPNLLLSRSYPKTALLLYMAAASLLSIDVLVSSSIVLYPAPGEKLRNCFAAEAALASLFVEPFTWLGLFVLLAAMAGGERARGAEQVCGPG
jgi:hypothetical protein